MTMIQILLVTATGFAAGIINAAAGSGSLVTYPVLLAIGIPPVTASITNTVGLVPGSLAAAWNDRRILLRERRMCLRIAPVAALGAVIGAGLLKFLPPSIFQSVVPVLVFSAAVLIGLQPLIAKRLGLGAKKDTSWVALSLLVFGSSIYGGYFSAAQGIILLAVLGFFVASDLITQNALKNLLQAVVNVVAAVFFVVSTEVNWSAVICLAVGSVLGAPAGIRLVRVIPGALFRAVVMTFGVVMAVFLATS